MQNVELENKRTEVMNQNICEMMRANAGVDHGLDKQAWWDWWLQ